jgi:nucleoside-diphosphate-sugar epimerase
MIGRIRFNYLLLKNSKKSFIKYDNVTCLNIDLSSDWDIKLLPEKVDVIYHLAQSEHFRDFPGKALDVFNVNTVSTLKLLDYACNLGCDKFIYASSGGVYGNSSHGFSEDSPLVSKGNLGFYLGSKFCSELIADSYTELLDVLTVRFFFVYGPRQNRNMLIPRLVDMVKSGKEITIQGENGLKINPIHVEDTANLLEQMLSMKGSSKLNLGGSEVLSLREIVELIAKRLGADPLIMSDGESEPKHLIGDISKIENLLSSPQIKFEEGISGLL